MGIKVGGPYDLREVEGVVPDGVEHQILQLVDDPEQILTERRHRRWKAADQVDGSGRRAKMTSRLPRSDRLGRDGGQKAKVFVQCSLR